MVRRMYIQTGAVRNQGIELCIRTIKIHGINSVGTPASHYSMNRNKILTLASDAINPITGENFSIGTLNMGGLGEARFLLKEGGSMGDLYSFIDLKRDANSKIYIDQSW